MINSNAGMTEEQKKINELTQTLQKEKMRLIHAQAQQKSKLYNDTKKELETLLGHPYIETVATKSSAHYQGAMYPRSRSISGDNVESKRTVSNESHDALPAPTPANSPV